MSRDKYKSKDQTRYENEPEKEHQQSKFYYQHNTHFLNV